MRKPALLLGAVGVLVVAVAVVFRLISEPPPPPDVPDASVEAPAVVDSGAPLIVDAGAPTPPRPARQWTLNPRVFSDRGEGYATLQEAIDATEGSQRLTVQSGIIDAPIRIANKTKLHIEGKDGPVYLRVSASDVPGIDITSSSEITLEGIIVEKVGDGDPPPANIRITDSAKVTLRRVFASNAANCVEASKSRDLLIEDTLIGPCAEAAVRSADGAGELVVVRSRLFTSRSSFALTQADPEAASPEVKLTSVIATSGFDAQVLNTKIALNTSLIADRTHAKLEALKPRLTVAGLEEVNPLGPPTDELRAAWRDAFAAGKSVLVTVDPSPPVEHLGDAPGMDFSWNLTVEDRLAAAALLDTALPADSPPGGVEEGPVIVGQGAAFPLCGKDGKLKIYGSQEVVDPAKKEVASCEELSNDLGATPEWFTLTSVSRSWVHVKGNDGTDGYILAKDLHAAEEISTGDALILMPGFKCVRGFSPAKDSILVKCAADQCSGETCSYEEDGKLTTSGNPTVQRSDHELPLPSGAKVTKGATITVNFSAVCCT